jgi:hypothetical protein
MTYVSNELVGVLRLGVEKGRVALHHQAGFFVVVDFRKKEGIPFLG